MELKGKTVGAALGVLALAFVGAIAIGAITMVRQDVLRKQMRDVATWIQGRSIDTLWTIDTVADVIHVFNSWPASNTNETIYECAVDVEHRSFIVVNRTPTFVKEILEASNEPER